MRTTSNVLTTILEGPAELAASAVHDAHRFDMLLSFERKLPIILFFVFLMLTTIGVLFYMNTMSSQEALVWQRQSQEISGIVDETVALTFEIQSALTSFMLVGNDTYLNPVDGARQKARQNLDRLRTLTTNDAAQVDEVNRIDQTLKEYLAEVSRKIDLRKMQGPDVAGTELIWSEGKSMLDRMRASGERIKSIQSQKQLARDRGSERTFVITVWVLILSSVAGIISLAFANLTVSSEIKKRRKAQEKLIEANENLEHKVEERTSELQVVNRKLMDSAQEREIILASEKESRKEAEIANRLRDEFMATVSHELRTPLNSILGWARMMKDGTLDPAQSEKALNTIIKNSESQNRLIEDLLDVARVISGKLQLELRDLAPEEIVSQAIETVRPQADLKNVSLRFKPGTTLPIIKGDKERLVQVFTNLVGNAVKFSPDGSFVDIEISEKDGSLITRVTDNGKGISPAFLPLVFERFRQDSTNTTANGGLGLGLAIVRNLVEIHGGSVNAESEGEGRGSTFTVILPVSAEEQTPLT
ncbi:MAG TPA: ATP-binding protein [Pyrinomonadaceae bacterium]|nr:ATP-binding protein [Pyrinomonadaceae bacterium]